MGGSSSAITQPVEVVVVPQRQTQGKLTSFLQICLSTFPPVIVLLVIGYCDFCKICWMTERERKGECRHSVPKIYCANCDFFYDTCKKCVNDEFFSEMLRIMQEHQPLLQDNNDCVIL